jgi:3(or 17)beta-hydroxysteroid dehydrogenase
MTSTNTLGTRLIDLSTSKPKIAVVTGAARGIGAGIARQLAKQSAKVVITDLLSMENEAQKTVDEIKDFGGEATFYALDVAIEEDWENAFEQIEKQYGPIDIHVNNAGILVLEPNLEDLTLEQWRKTTSINLDGVFLGTKYAVRSMKKRTNTTEYASIINMSSVAGFSGFEGMYSYTASKGGVRIFSKSAALYGAKHKIRVNTIHPGGIDTPLMRSVDVDGTVKATPLGRLGEPKEIGDSVVFLASNESSYMTGSELVVDGGLLA